MNETELRLYNLALQRHSTIYPCASTSSFKECFTLSNDRLLFWYNTADNSTHVLMEEPCMAS